NYPNPFNPQTTIQLELPTDGFVSLKIYNVLGQEVATLVSDNLSAGSYKYVWNASNFASGIYVYRLEANGQMMDKKMILLR
ncbi:MAG: T9SS type A sorting domain-containing protein, partial [Ignavibacteriaceae bacterium]|nr:T9SS type A sorting domain-containing protein [Ignavibacteriaceae bacterium]